MPKQRPVGQECVKGDERRTTKDMSNHKQIDAETMVQCVKKANALGTRIKMKKMTKLT